MARNNNNFTAAQRSAYGAGMAYGLAKQGKRVPVKDENKESFRAGVKAARSSGSVKKVGKKGK